MRAIGKKYWLIRRPIPSDSKKWTFLLGSNTGIFDDYPSIELIRFDSEEAQAFFPMLNLSKKQRFQQIQPTLPNVFNEERDIDE